MRASGRRPLSRRRHPVECRRGQSRGHRRGYRHPDGVPLFRRVLERGGHATIRVMARRRREHGTLHRKAIRFGCGTGGASGTIVADVPPTVDLVPIIEWSERGYRARGWILEFASISGVAHSIGCAMPTIAAADRSMPASDVAQSMVATPDAPIASGSMDR